MALIICDTDYVLPAGRYAKLQVHHQSKQTAPRDHPLFVIAAVHQKLSFLFASQYFVPQSRAKQPGFPSDSDSMGPPPVLHISQAE